MDALFLANRPRCGNVRLGSLDARPDPVAARHHRHGPRRAPPPSGQGLFVRTWLPFDAASSCAACHNQGLAVPMVNASTCAALPAIGSALPDRGGGGTFGRIDGIDLGPDVRVVDVSKNWQAPSGRWTVPDLVLFAKQSYDFFSGYDLEVITFEVKTEKNVSDTSVSQSISQSMFAHQGYLVWHCPKGPNRDAFLPRLRIECRTTGIGLIVVHDPMDHNSYEISVRAERRAPPKWQMEQFLIDRLGDQGDEIGKWLRGAP